jgi:hypothetical protein
VECKLEGWIDLKKGTIEFKEWNFLHVNDEIKTLLCAMIKEKNKDVLLIFSSSVKSTGEKSDYVKQMIQVFESEKNLMKTGINVFEWKELGFIWEPFSSVEKKEIRLYGSGKRKNIFKTGIEIETYINKIKKMNGILKKAMEEISEKLQLIDKSIYFEGNQLVFLKEPVDFYSYVHLNGVGEVRLKIIFRHTQTTEDEPEILIQKVIEKAKKHYQRVRLESIYR